jgi:hypothetical protein
MRFSNSSFAIHHSAFLHIPHSEFRISPFAAVPETFAESPGVSNRPRGMVGTVMTTNVQIRRGRE